MKRELLTIKEASAWASEFLKKKVATTNITYLIQYGKIKKYNKNGTTLVNRLDLESYYDSFHGKRENSWKDKLGKDLNWSLSFDHLREKDTTKHVHRFHPYKGKFIPQLVEYFIDQHVNAFKKNIFFREGDIILDPFSGSGTTLVQANELNIHSIGIDISKFNCSIAESKLLNYNLDALKKDIKMLIDAVIQFETDNKIKEFENELMVKLKEFNQNNFPSPDYKFDLNKGKYNEDDYSIDKQIEFTPIYNRLISKYRIKLKQKSSSSFLDKWFINNVRKEIDYTFDLIRNVKNTNNKKILSIILSRTIRSCRATTHSDLGTLKEPQLKAYYCYKHKKICKPVFSIKSMFSRYANDTLKRLKEFEGLKSNANFALIPGDSRKVNIYSEVKRKNKEFYLLLNDQKIKGVFSSPPYVGQIDYHEQHAYSYELLGYKRNDELEIGPLYKGQGVEARKSYVESISKVLINCCKFMVENPDIFIVANDKYNLYPEIAKKAKLKIVNEYKRPVLNRTERDKSPYSEKIFHLKAN